MPSQESVQTTAPAPTPRERAGLAGSALKAMQGATGGQGGRLSTPTITPTTHAPAGFVL